MAKFLVFALLALNLLSADAAWMVATEDAVQASEWLISSRYESSNCSSPPAHVFGYPDCSVNASSGSGKAECHQIDYSSSSSLAGDETIQYQSSECSTNLTASLDDLFGDKTYVRYDYFNHTDCTSSALLTHAFLVDGKCHSTLMPANEDAPFDIQGWIFTLEANGSIIRSIYTTGDCTGELMTALELNKTSLETGACNFATIGTTNADLSGSDASTTQDTSDVGGSSASHSAGSAAHLPVTTVASLVVVGMLVM